MLNDCTRFSSSADGYRVIVTDAETSPSVLRSVAEEEGRQDSKEKALENFFLHVLYSEHRVPPRGAKNLQIRISLRSRRVPQTNWVKIALNGWDECLVILKEPREEGTGRLLSVIYRDPTGGNNAFFGSI